MTANTSLVVKLAAENQIQFKSATVLRGIQFPRNGTDAYSADMITHLADLIQRANPDVQVDPTRLEERLFSLFAAVAVVDDGTDYTRNFREFAGHGPSHAELAKRSRAIAAAADPHCHATRAGILLTELNAVARIRWSRQIRAGRFDRYHPLKGHSAASLMPQEVADLRAMALQLAAYHESFVRRARPTKNDQNTLLLGLADIFIELAKLDCGPFDLPHAENSRFITFAHAAIRPYFPATEATVASISRRWKRLKDANSLGRP